MTMNVTVDLSNTMTGVSTDDRQLATGNVYINSLMLQTLHDYQRWKQEDALLYCKPPGFPSLCRLCSGPGEMLISHRNL